VGEEARVVRVELTSPGRLIEPADVLEEEDERPSMTAQARKLRQSPVTHPSQPSPSQRGWMHLMSPSSARASSSMLQRSST
jgi:hypothetical protein